MPVAPPNVICSPYIGRTIKGWRVRVRVCFSLDPVEVATAALGANFIQVQTDITALLNALSEVTFVAAGGTAPVVAIPYGDGGAYGDAEDSATFSFLTAQGTVAKLSIPAPLPTIFLADGQTVDPTNDAVVALVAYLTNPLAAMSSNAVASTTSGAGYISFIGGLRVRHRTRRKMNIFIRDARLATPAI